MGSNVSSAVPRPRRRSFRRLHFGPVLVVCYLLSYPGVEASARLLGWSLPGSATEPKPILEVPAAELELGTVYEMTPRVQSLHITNVSTNPVVIARFETTCECAGISPARE